MAVRTIVKKNTYFDSVSLMVLSTKANQLPGVKQAVIAMGADLNKDVLRNVGLWSEAVVDATPGDLMIVVEAETEDLLDEIFQEIEELLVHKDDGALTQETKFAGLASAVDHLKEANLAVISVPGTYAFREAQKALDAGLNVMLFSDNVSIEDELTLKQKAHEKGLIVMGPDCGTTIIGGKGICFANEVRRGSIGIVAASGTGSQEVSVRVHDFGGGISHLIGTGGRDLSEKIGGISMLDGLLALERNPETKIIILISKTPCPTVAQKIYAQVKSCTKPIIICFLGGNEQEITASGAVYAKTTKEAALKAVILSGKNEAEINTHPLNLPLIAEVRKKLHPEQRYIRGLFCGGTVCGEVLELVKAQFDNVYSNVSKDPSHQLSNIQESREHTFIDLGDDQFTRGRPHPMIDPTLRIDRFLKEASDPEVGVIVLDFILGYGSHPDPVGTMLPHIQKAKQDAAQRGRHLEILAFVLGTERDVQNFDEQVQLLIDEGVTIASSVVNTALLAAGFVSDKEV